MENNTVSVSWLKAHINDNNLVVLDASTGKKVSGEVSAIEGKRIKGARFFDLKNKFSDPDSEYPNTVPSPERFEKNAQALGINQDSLIVIYDNLGIYTSPRAWWLFKSMGHINVAVLDGGLPEWIAQGGETEEEDKAEEYALGNFKADYKADKMRDFDFVRENLSSELFQVLDARSKGRFEGTAPEPREGLRSGSIPNSINLPYTAVLEKGKFKSKEAIKAIVNELELDDRPLVFSCGSGVTACIILLAVAMVTDQDKSVYDGSWTEWAQRF